MTIPYYPPAASNYPPATSGPPPLSLTLSAQAIPLPPAGSYTTSSTSAVPALSGFLEQAPPPTSGDAVLSDEQKIAQDEDSARRRLKRIQWVISGLCLLVIRYFHDNLYVVVSSEYVASS